jgi:FkbM family methyltransferase
MERLGEHLTAAVDDLRAILGPRLDELEIKVRPLIDFDEESYAVRVRDGYVMLPRSEPLFAVMVVNAMSGGLEPGTRLVLQALIQPGMGVADVGANVGLLTLACAFATGPSGRVYAFEPEAGPRAQLLKTVKLNGLSWVEVSDLAVGGQSGPASFHISPIIGHSSLFPLPSEEHDAARTVQVEVTRLDDAIPRNARLDVVKIDVEGGELDVLRGMSRLLADNPDIALVAEFGPSHLQRLGIDPGAWLAAFAQVGLTPYLITEPTGLCRPITQADLKDVMSVNLAFVRPGGAAQGRLPQ